MMMMSDAQAFALKKLLLLQDTFWAEIAGEITTMFALI